MIARRWSRESVINTIISWNCKVAVSHNIYYGKLLSLGPAVPQLDDESVAAGFDAPRQFGAELTIVQALIHVRQHCAPGAHAADPGQRLCKMRVRRVRFAAQAIDDPHLDPCERDERVVFEFGDISLIRKSPDPET